MYGDLFHQEAKGGAYDTVGQKGLYRFEISVDALMFLDAKKEFFTEVKLKKRNPQGKHAYENLCSEMYGLIEKIKPLLLLDHGRVDDDGVKFVEEAEEFFGKSNIGFSYSEEYSELSATNASIVLLLSDRLLDLMYKKEIYDPTIIHKIQNPKKAYEESI